MAEKRMFSSLVLGNDDFIEMPVDARMLYIDICMAADDRGICDSPRAVMRTDGARNDSMKLLIEKKFLISPECNPKVVVVKHWWIHNNCRKERFKETKYTDVLSELYFDNNKSYSKNPNGGHISCIDASGKIVWPPDIPELISAVAPALPAADESWVPNGYPTDTQWVPQNRLDKNRLDKISVEQNSVGESVRGGETPSPPASGSEEKIEELKQRLDNARAAGNFSLWISYKHMLQQIYGVDYGGEWTQ